MKRLEEQRENYSQSNPNEKVTKPLCDGKVLLQNIIISSNYIIYQLAILYWFRKNEWVNKT